MCGVSGDIVNPLGLMVTDCIFLNCFGAVLQGISDGLSRGKKPDEMEKLVNFCETFYVICLFILQFFNIFSNKKLG